MTVAFRDEAAPDHTVRLPVAALSIAGSDPSGGVGTQADLKTFGALGAHGMAVVTALTVQNTRDVTRVEPVASGLLAGQLQAVVDDLRIDTVKIGMLGTEENILTVPDALQGPLRARPIVLDPVLVSTSGSRFARCHRRGHSVRTQAKRWVTGALQGADRLVIGGGQGPVHHFHGSPGPLLAIPRKVPA